MTKASTDGLTHLRKGDFDYVGTSTTRTKFNPLQLQDLLEGLDKRQNIIMVQGEKFSIRYVDENRFWYKSENRVPCGYSDIRRLRDILEGM